LSGIKQGTVELGDRLADVDCRYATIHDAMNPASKTDVCGGWRRLSHVMTSRRHELQVNFIGSLVDERVPNFLLQYQGTSGEELQQVRMYCGSGTVAYTARK